MATTKISHEIWTAARLRWETEPTCQYSDLVEFLGISRQGIGKRARSEGWSKMLDMGRIVGLAHQKADRQSTASNAEKSTLLAAQEPIVVHPEPRKFDGNPNSETLHIADQTAAVTARAALLERHRAEWVAVRNLLYTAIKGKDYDMSRTAKNAVDAMKKIQEGERDAWDLNNADAKPPLQIIIERHAGVRIVR